MSSWWSNPKTAPHSEQLRNVAELAEGSSDLTASLPVVPSISWVWDFQPYFKVYNILYFHGSFWLFQWDQLFFVNFDNFGSFQSLLQTSLCKGLWTRKRFWSDMSSREMFHITTAHSSTKSSASILEMIWLTWQVDMNFCVSWCFRSLKHLSWWHNDDMTKNPIITEVYWSRLLCQVLLAIMMHCSSSFTERCRVSTSRFSCSAAESNIFDVGSSFFTSALGFRLGNDIIIHHTHLHVKMCRFMCLQLLTISYPLLTSQSKRITYAKPLYMRATLHTRPLRGPKGHGHVQEAFGTFPNDWSCKAPRPTAWPQPWPSKPKLSPPTSEVWHCLGVHFNGEMKWC